MSEILVPIALSSQLDVTGEERVHAAQYFQPTREVYIESIPIVWQLSEGETVSTRRLRTGYATLNVSTFAFTTLATIDYEPAHLATSNVGFVMDGDLIMRIWTDQTSISGSQVSGVYALRYNNTATLLEIDRWQHSTDTLNVYHDIVKYDASTVIVVMKRPDPSYGAWLHALSYSGGAFADVGTPLEIDPVTNYPVMTMHNGTIIVCDEAIGSGRYLSAYTWNGSTFSLAGTYGGTITNSFSTASHALHSDGSYLYLPNGQIFTYAAGTFTLVTTATVGGAGYATGLAEFPGHIIMGNSGTTLSVMSFDGATTATVDTVVNTWNLDGGAVVVNDNIYLRPTDDFDNLPALGGIYLWNGTDLVRQGDLVLDNDLRVKSTLITIQKLDSKL